MSSIISKFKKIWARFSEKSYRDAFASAHLADHLAAQIYFLREQRGWTQVELAEKAEMRQPRISKLEESCDGVSISTLKKLASAFDVALSVKFVSFSVLAHDAVVDAPDKTIPTFLDDSEPNVEKSAIITISGTANAWHSSISLVAPPPANDFGMHLTLSPPAATEVRYAH